jgi:hypothetical protein
MSSDGDVPRSDQGGPDIVEIDAITEAEDRQEAVEYARIWVWIVPVAVMHLALLYSIVRSVFDFRLPAYLHTNQVVAWLWVNGAAISLAIWLWKKGRFPIAPGKWLRGRQARWLILLWLGASLAWFVLPVLIKGAWAFLPPSVNGW